MAPLAFFWTITLLMGLAFIIASMVFFRSERRFARTGVVVVGRVVDVEEHRSRSASGGISVYFHPVIDYQTTDGRRLRTSTEVNANRRHSIGAQVKIRYLPDAPTRIRLVGETQARLVFAIFLGMGTLLTLIGLALLAVWGVKLAA
jgi:hypothetical protein